MNAEIPDLGSFQMSSQVACDLSDRIAAFDPRSQDLRQSDDLGRGQWSAQSKKGTFLSEEKALFGAKNHFPNTIRKEP